MSIVKESVFPTVFEILSKEKSNLRAKFLDEKFEVFPDILAANQDLLETFPYLATLARLELLLYKVSHSDFNGSAINETKLSLNPTLQLFNSSWGGLLRLIKSKDAIPTPDEAEYILIYRHLDHQKVCSRVADNNDLLALKIISEQLDPLQVAKDNNVKVGMIDKIMEEAVEKGLLISPKSKILRDLDFVKQNEVEIFKQYLSADVFTLQWHLTQACDLHCKHCYDRSNRNSIDFSAALNVLEEMRHFCLAKNVYGQITFTGGNPLLYPEFNQLYQAATDYNFAVAVLGNPTSREKLEELTAIKMPEFFQVSLEGLEPHNDQIRGSGHFKRTINFLEILRSLNIYSMVMLTLTDENMEQVIPLAEFLRDKVDLFTFNRLSTVGEGASLKSASRNKFASFLEEFLLAANDNKVMALKDNLFNIHLHKSGKNIFGGCAGYGCGAAFNFVSLLPDGEVHACRKFPSPIGNILNDNLLNIYDSELAKKFRQGSKACNDCQLRLVCRGCPAVVHGLALDVNEDLDPYCFM